MVAVDTNVLVYGYRADASLHDRAEACLRQLAEGRPTWAIPWPCIHEFLNIVTHPRIYDPPSPLRHALAQVDAWMESPTLQLLSETAGHWSRLSALSQAGAIQGPRIHDARIAALCLEHGVSELWTADRDFGRFPDLRTRNPLVRPKP